MKIKDNYQWRLSIARYSIENILFNNRDIANIPKNLYSWIDKSKYHHTLTCRANAKKESLDEFWQENGKIHLLLSADAHRLYFSMIRLLRSCIDNQYRIPLWICLEKLHHDGRILKNNVYEWIVYSLSLKSKSFPGDWQSYIESNLQSASWLLLGNLTELSQNEKELVVQEVNQLIEHPGFQITAILADTTPDTETIWSNSFSWIPSEYDYLDGWPPSFKECELHILNLAKHGNFSSALIRWAWTVSEYLAPWYEEKLRELLVHLYQLSLEKSYSCFLSERVLTDIRENYQKLFFDVSNTEKWGQVKQWLDSLSVKRICPNISDKLKLLLLWTKGNAEDHDRWITVDSSGSESQDIKGNDILSVPRNTVQKILNTFIENFFAEDPDEQETFLSKVHRICRHELFIQGIYLSEHTTIAYFVHAFSKLFGWEPEHHVIWLGNIDSHYTPKEILQPLKVFPIQPIPYLLSALKAIICNCPYIQTVVVAEVHRQELLQIEDAEVMIEEKEECLLFARKTTEKQCLRICFATTLHDLLNINFFKKSRTGIAPLEYIADPIGYYLQKMSDPVNHRLRPRFRIRGKEGPEPDPCKPQFIQPRLLTDKEDRWQRGRNATLAEIDERDTERIYWEDKNAKEAEFIGLQDLASCHTQKGTDISRLIILGEGGIGKSFLLQSLTIALSRQVFDNLFLIPIIIQCSNLLKNKDSDFIHSQRDKSDILNRLVQILPDLNLCTFSRAICQSVALLLDALDEAPGHEQEIIAKIERFLHNSDINKPVLVVITTRPAATIWQRLDFRLARQQRLSKKHIQNFIQEYAGDRAESWTKQIEDNPSVQDMLANPLFLNMLVHLQRQNRIPENPTELIKKLIDQILHYEQQERTGKERTRDEWSEDFKKFLKTLLEYLAFQWLKRGETSPNNNLSYEQAQSQIEQMVMNFIELWPRKEDMAAISERPNIISLLLDTNLLVPVAIGDDVPCQFLHRMFQDYFAGAYLAAHPKELEQVVKKIRSNYYLYQQWEEPVVFAMDIIKDTKRDFVFKLLTQLSKPRYDDIFHHQLFLTAKIIGYTRLRDFPLRISLRNKILNINENYYQVLIFGVIGIRTEEISPKFKAFEQIAIKEDLPHILPLLRSKDRGIRNNICKIIGNLYKREALPYLLDILQHDDIPFIRSTACHVIGKICIQEDIPHILPILNDQDLNIRREVSIMMENVYTSEEDLTYILPLLQHRDSYVRVWAAKVFEKISNEENISYILPLLNDQDAYVRRKVCKIIGKISKRDALPHILPLLNDQDYSVRHETQGVIEKISNPKDIQLFISLLQEDDDDIQERGEKLIIKMYDRKQEMDISNKDKDILISYILRLLNDKSISVIWLAAEILEKICNRKEYLPYVYPLLQHKDASVRIAACKVLGNILHRDALPYILPLLHDKNFHVRVSTCHLIGKLYKREALPLILPLINDRKLCNRVGEVIKDICTREDISHILPLLQHKDSHVRVSAIEWITKICDQKEDISHILPLLQHKDGHVRVSAIEWITKICDQKALQYIFPLLCDKDQYVRWKSCELIGQMGNPNVLPHILPLLKDSKVCLTACEVIEKLGKPEHVQYVLPLLLLDNELIAERVCKIIEKLGKPEHVQYVLPLLTINYIHSYASLDAMKVIEKLGKPEHVQYVLPLLYKQDPLNRDLAYYASSVILKIGEPENIIHLLNDKNRSVIWIACKVLEKRGYPRHVRNILFFLNKRPDIQEFYLALESIASRYKLSIHMPNKIVLWWQIWKQKLFALRRLSD